MSYHKKPEDRSYRSGLSIPIRVKEAIDIMRGVTPRATFMAAVLKDRWHTYLDQHPELVETIRKEDPEMLLNYDERQMTDALSLWRLRRRPATSQASETGSPARSAATNLSKA
ncbi:MAG: hypothetical protein HZC54_00835 [Verrucomicrobia bacterium]|nr:hypothetical protein [Verrucomicrobiota bacterium]